MKRKNTVEKNAIRSKQRRTRLVNIDNSVVKYEQPRCYPPDSVYFVKEDDYQISIAKPEEQRQSCVGVIEQQLELITQDEGLRQVMLDFYYSEASFSHCFDSVGDILLALQFYHNITGGRIAIVTDFSAEYFSCKFEIMSFAEFNTFQPEYDCVCYVQRPKYANELQARKVLDASLHIALCSVETGDKCDNIARIVNDFGLKKQVVIYAHDASRVVEQLLRRSVDQRVIKRLEFFDRKLYNNTYVVVLADFFYDLYLPIPNVEGYYLCQQKSDYLTAVNRLACLTLYEPLSVLKSGKITFEDQLEKQLLYYILRGTGALLKYAQFKAYPTNDQCLADKQLVTIKGRQFSAAKADPAQLYRKGVAVYGIEAYQQFSGADGISEEAAHVRQKEFIVLKKAELDAQYHELFKCDYPKYASQLSAEYYSVMMSVIGNEEYQEIPKIKEKALEINREAQDSLVLIISKLSANPQATELVKVLL